jgi:hypothetical protein
MAWRLLSLVLIPWVVQAVYQDEAGLEEALRVYSGVPFTAQGGGVDTVFMATRASTLVSSNPATGDLHWRVVLPTEKRLLDASFSVKGVVAALSTVSSSSSQVEVSAWSPGEGAPLWSHTLGGGRVSMVSSPFSPVVAGVGGGKLHVWEGLGGVGGVVGGVEGEVVASTFGGDGGLLALTLGPKGKVSLYTAAPSDLTHPTLAIPARDFGGEKGKAMRGEGNLTLLPTAVPGAGVVASVVDGGASLLLSWVQQTSTSSPAALIKLSLASDLGLASTPTATGLCVYPVTSHTPSAAAAAASAGQFIALHLPNSQGYAVVGVHTASREAFLSHGVTLVGVVGPGVEGGVGGWRLLVLVAVRVVAAAVPFTLPLCWQLVVVVVSSSSSSSSLCPSTPF